jgi:two-component system sensor histidine kinase KdpD
LQSSVGSLSRIFRRQPTKLRQIVNSLFQGFKGIVTRAAANLGREPTAPGFARTRIVPLAITLALVGLATITLFVLQDLFDLLNLVSIIYLIPVVIAALRWGTLPAITAALAGAAGADFFFYPPLFSFQIGDTQNIADLVVFLIVALVTGNLAARLKREANSLRQHEQEIRELYAFSQQLAACFTVSDLTQATQEFLSESLGRRAFLLGALDVDRESSDRDAIPQQVRQAAAALIANGEAQTRTIVDGPPRQVWLVRGVSLGTAEYAVIVDLGSGSPDVDGVVDRRVDTILEEAAKTLARLDVAKAIEEAKLLSQAEVLRDALVGALSHELRTPLAAILGSVSVLDQMPIIKGDPRAHSLVEAIFHEAGRLDGDVQHLLNAARISARGGQPHREWTDPVDIVNAAIEQKRAQLGRHRLELSLAPDVPLVKVHSALVEQALGQLLENAAKYSPIDSTIKLFARVEQDRVVLSITDKGAGLTPDEKRHLGQRSFRGSRHLAVVPGAGLGLWIANTFVTANGGTLDAESLGPGLGTTVSIRLPAADVEAPDAVETS